MRRPRGQSRSAARLSRVIASVAVASVATRVLVADVGVGCGFDDERSDQVGTADVAFSARDGNGDRLAALERLGTALRGQGRAACYASPFRGALANTIGQQNVD